MSLQFNNENSQVRYNNKSYFDKNIRSLTERQVKWMQTYLAYKVNVSFSSNGSSDRHEELMNQLSRHENFKDYVSDAYSEMTYKLVPEQNFEWLVDNLRSQIFVLNILSKEKGYIYFDINSNNLMEEIYSFFDNKDNANNLESKIFLLSDMQKRWSSIIRSENYSKWLVESDILHIEWTKDYLRKVGIYNKSVRNNKSSKETRNHILASLDLIDHPVSEIMNDNYINYRSSDRKEIIIDKMKRAWSQQKYRSAGKTKKAYHLPLTKKTKAKLEKMAQVQGLSETAMLDILINRFYDLDYVDVDGKELY
ncbi:hypothetical protein JCM18903_892 [Psychrobacter sp. JCM 18903]|uniref:hypothetical protein n=1 Tax=Psychrobacter sp. JCM 18903 TaxID=1298610 RepID=UPI000432DF27|nr:hypothetical protein [Psychrobacter sp. JCM 18903]GAF60937.1 hypothetical protein JCM18903_892 [Psychrobacter sp. JCM 18903]